MKNKKHNKQWIISNWQLATGKNICRLPIAFYLFLLISTTIKAQNELPINLQAVLELGGANNLTIQEYKNRQELAMADLTKAKEWWLPEIQAGLQTHQLWGAAMNADGRFFLDVSRANFWSGLGLNANWDFGDGIYRRKAAGFNAEAMRHESQAQRNQALLKSISAYYDFQAAQLYYKAYEELVHQSDTITRQIELQVEAGLRFESELLLSKSNLNHLKVQMLKARAEYATQSSRLTGLLNLDPNVKPVSVDTILAPIELTGELMEKPDFETMAQNRPEHKKLESHIQSLEMVRKTTTTGLLIPKLNVNTYGSYFGGMFSPVQPMFPQEFPDPKVLYPTSALNISLMWSIPLGRLIYGGDLKQYDAQIAIGKTQMDQLKARVNEEVLNYREQIRLSAERMEMARQGGELAAEALSQSIQRQELGTAKPFEVLQAQEIYIKSRLDYLSSVADHNKAQYRLFVASGNNL